MTSQIWHSGAHHVLYDAMLMPQPATDFFDPDWWQARNAVQARFSGRGQALLVAHDGARWVLRRYLRGGLVAKVSNQTYVWTGLDNTRAWQEWHLTAALRAQGLPVPRPVAAHVVRQGAWYRGDLLTEYLPGTQPFCDLLAAGQATPAHWQRIGSVLRQLREADVHHPDLNVRNVLIDAQDQVQVIDFDKARFGTTAVQFAKDLARFKRSIDKFNGQQPAPCVREADWQTLLDVVNA